MSTLPFQLRAILKDLHVHIMNYGSPDASEDSRIHAYSLMEIYLHVFSLVQHAETTDAEFVTGLLPMHVRDWAASNLDVPPEHRHFVETKEGWVNGEDMYRDFNLGLPTMR